MKFSAILLAAGMSRRMDGHNKLALTIEGEPLIRRTAKTLLSSSVVEVIVVLGHEADKVRHLLEGLDLRFVLNENYVEGQMTSVHCGVQALKDPVDGILVCLSDLPFMTVTDINLLTQSFTQMTEHSVLVPTWQGRRGNPIILSHVHRDEILSGNRNLGCKKLIQKHPELVKSVEMPNDHLMIDVDTPEAYAAVISRFKRENEESKVMS